MVSIKDLRKRAAAELKPFNLDSPTADVDCILASLGFSKTDLIIGEKTVSPQIEAEFNYALSRLKKSEPVRYIVGECEFMSLKFRVNSSTLIPRADTEILVESVLDRLDSKNEWEIFDIGSGSGCIAISLGKYLPFSKVISADISDEALRIARQNAEDNGVAERVEFCRCDIMKDFKKINKSFDAVVSNPPYIPSADIQTLDKKVRDYEPLTALDGGADGLDFYRHISKIAPLKPGGLLAFEVGINQHSEVENILRINGFEKTEVIKDLSGINRVVLGRKAE